MLEDIRLLADKPNQFLGDPFKGVLNRREKQSEGQFFTPLPIVCFIVSLLPIQALVRNLPDPTRVIDNACGSGHFLNEYARQAKPFIAGYAPQSAREHFGAISGVESCNGIETFFVERTVQLLKPFGIAAVILPSSILSNGSAAYVRCRDIFLRCFDMVAIAEFGTGTFGKTGTNTVTLFLR